MRAVLLVLGPAAAVIALWAGGGWTRSVWLVRNRRGRDVPAVLGLSVFVAGLGPIAFRAAYLAIRNGTMGSLEGSAWITCGAVLVFVAGLVDDVLGPGGPRGLRGHLESLRRARPTTGILKLTAAVAGAGVAVYGLPHRPTLPTAMGLIVMAGSTNLWNGLDVAPGRAAKAFLAAALAVLAVGPWTRNVLLTVLGAGIPCAWLDLRERAMLGDAGANLLGFVIGAELYVVLSTGGLVIAVVGLVALNLLAETVTLSRVIDATSPLRWADRFGRVREGAA